MCHNFASLFNCTYLCLRSLSVITWWINCILVVYCPRTSSSYHQLATSLQISFSATIIYRFPHFLVWKITIESKVFEYFRNCFQIKTVFSILIGISPLTLNKQYRQSQAPWPQLPLEMSSDSASASYSLTQHFRWTISCLLSLHFYTNRIKKYLGAQQELLPFKFCCVTPVQIPIDIDVNFINIFCTAFLYLHFVFVIFWWKIIGKRCS